MTIINVEDVIKLLEARREINKIPFHDIEWHFKGVPITFPEGYKDEWCYVGLSNLTFVETLEGELCAQ